MKSTAAQNISSVELILRNRVFNSYYWKEKCFGLTSETIIDKILELKYIGGMNHSSNQPTDFICLFIKLLQLNPSEEIIDEYLSDPDLKYLRALTALFIRFAYPPYKIYTKLEKLYCDYKKLVILKSKGYAIIHMDEYIDQLLNDEHIFEISLPKIPKRSVLEENGELSPYVSVLENELNVDRNKKDEDKSESESETEEEKDIDIFKNLKIPENFFKNKKRKRSEDKNEKTEKKEKDKEKHKHKHKKEESKIENKKDINKNIDIDSKLIKENKIEEEKKIKLPDLDPESDEYWLELRKRIGID
jgi:pre-mRNA-splicing factor 38A